MENISRFRFEPYIENNIGSKIVENKMVEKVNRREFQRAYPMTLKKQNLGGDDSFGSFASSGK